MEKLARRTYRIGSFGFIGIGALHTYAHVTELAGEELKGRFDEMGTILVQGTDAASWDLFQGVSLLMGFFSIVLGFANLAAERAAGRPPAGVSLVNIAMLVSVMIVGVLYLGALQVYGSMFGITMFAIPVLAAWRSARRRATPYGPNPLGALPAVALV